MHHCAKVLNHHNFCSQLLLVWAKLYSTGWDLKSTSLIQSCSCWVTALGSSSFLPNWFQSICQFASRCLFCHVPSWRMTTKNLEVGKQADFVSCKSRQVWARVFPRHVMTFISTFASCGNNMLTYNNNHRSFVICVTPVRWQNCSRGSVLKEIARSILLYQQ